MVRSIAWCLVVTLVLGSGRLLACDWECGDAASAPAEVACHHESPDSGTPLIGGVAHECPPDAIEPVVTAAHKGEKQVNGVAQAPSQSISHAPASIGRLVSRPREVRAFVPHPFLINVLRI
jgi:hypothetical protein